MDKPQKQTQNLFQSVADRLSRIFKKSSDVEPEHLTPETEQPVPEESLPEPEVAESPELTENPIEGTQETESSEEDQMVATYPRRPHRPGKKKSVTKSIVELRPSEVAPAIEKYVMAHLSNEELSVCVMAKQLKCSRTVLYQIMHQTMGVTPATYILDMRMKYAEQILREGTSPREASIKCGFSDPKYFSKVFKKRYGVLPSGYKASLKKKKK